MLRRLTMGFVGLTSAIAIAACSSNNANNPVNVGPNFPSESLYATNATQNSVSIYPPKSGPGPSYQVSSTLAQLNGPQYIAFDSQSNLWISSFASSTGGAITELKALATGNVQPLLTSAQLGLVFQHPRGLAFATFGTGSSAVTYLVVANVDASAKTFSNQLRLYDTANSILTQSFVIAGPSTGMNVPSGVAASGKSIYVTNLQGASVEAFQLPSPSPSPSTSPSPTPSPTATPTVNPSAPPTPTPTPVPTATPVNVSPVLTISGGQTGITSPTGIAIDGSGNIYVSDQGNTGLGVQPSILVFPPNLSGAVSSAPIRKIQGSATKLFAPTDVKLDTSGNIYVGDSTSSGAGVVYVFAANATGNVAPTTTFTSPGTVIGIGLTP